MKYSIVPLYKRNDLRDQLDRICVEAWPEFMVQEGGLDDHILKIADVYRQYQLMLVMDNQVLSIMNAVPIHFEDVVENLPDRGWSWGVEKCLEDLQYNRKPNFLMALQIVVNPEYRGMGLGAASVVEMRTLARREGFERLIAPVRPNEKVKHPHVSMERYVHWTNRSRLPADAWLRAHVKAGGRMIKVCKASTTVVASIEAWQQWTGEFFTESGEYIVPGALNPISIDRLNNTGTYIEPNVWVDHALSV